MVVATGTAMLIGGVASAAAGAYGAYQQSKADEAARQANLQTLQVGKRDLGLGREKAQDAYSVMRGSQSEYADWAQQEPWRIAEDVDNARQAMLAGGLSSRETLKFAAAEREGYGTEALGMISQAEGLVMQEAERARTQARSARVAEGTVGSSAAAADIQMMEAQGRGLESAALAAGREASGIVQQTGRDVMGLRQQESGQEWSEGQTLGTMGMSEAAMLGGARQEGALAQRGIGEVEMAGHLADQQYYQNLASLRMGVQHQGQQGPNAWQTAGQSLGGMDWGAIAEGWGGGGGGGSQDMTAGYDPTSQAIQGLPQTGGYQAGYGVGPYQSAAPGTEWNPYASSYGSSY
jgi:hypothetical protein